MIRLISWGEVRLSLRLIAKQPVMSATVVLSLATGICLATMGFTFRDELVNATLPRRASDSGVSRRRIGIEVESTSIRTATMRSAIGRRRSRTSAHSARGRSR